MKKVPLEGPFFWGLMGGEGPIATCLVGSGFVFQSVPAMAWICSLTQAVAAR